MLDLLAGSALPCKNSSPQLLQLTSARSIVSIVVESVVGAQALEGRSSESVLLFGVLFRAPPEYEGIVGNGGSDALCSENRSHSADGKNGKTWRMEEDEDNELPFISDESNSQNVFEFAVCCRIAGMFLIVVAFSPILN